MASRISVPQPGIEPEPHEVKVQSLTAILLGKSLNRICDNDNSNVLGLGVLTMFIRPTCIASGDFPGGPVAKTPCSQCRGPRFHLWSGN